MKSTLRHDPARLAKLRELAILDTAPEHIFDDITRLLASTFKVPVTMVNMLDEQRDWFKSCIGFPVTESPAETSFCEVFLGSSVDLVVVEDTLADPQFSSHPMVIGEPFIRFYAGARLVVDGQTVGTLCAYDLKPRQISTADLNQLQLLAGTAMSALRARDRKVKVAKGDV